MTRPDWNTYFLAIASTVSIRSDCERRKVGAIVVKDYRIKGTGYNGAPAGMPGCESCPRRRSGVAPNSDYTSGAGKCVAIHAEANALLYSTETRGATLYITCPPCHECERLIQAAGIERVVYPPVV